MFKFIAVLFLVTNGVPADKPSGILTYNKEAFPTEEACMAFPETEAGKIAVQALKDLVESRHGEIAAKVACMRADAKTEDNSI